MKHKTHAFLMPDTTTGDITIWSLRYKIVVPADGYQLELRDAKCRLVNVKYTSARMQTEDTIPAGVYYLRILPQESSIAKIYWR